MVRRIAFLVFCCWIASGCHESRPARERDGNVNVVAPGVNVDVERKQDAAPGKVKVDAPGVKVDVNKQ